MRRYFGIFSICVAVSLAGPIASCGPVPDIHNDPEAMVEFQATLDQVTKLLANDEYQKAIEPAFQLMELAPDDLQVLTISSVVTARAGFPGDSLILAQQAYDLFPDNPSTQNNLSYSLAQMGSDLDRAYELIQLSIEELPDDPAVQDTMAWVLHKMNRSAEALPYIEKSLEGPWTPWEQDLVQSHLSAIRAAIQVHPKRLPVRSASTRPARLVKVHKQPGPFGVRTLPGLNRTEPTTKAHHQLVLSAVVRAPTAFTKSFAWAVGELQKIKIPSSRKKTRRYKHRCMKNFAEGNKPE